MGNKKDVTITTFGGDKIIHQKDVSHQFISGHTFEG